MKIEQSFGNFCNSTNNLETLNWPCWDFKTAKLAVKWFLSGKHFLCHFQAGKNWGKCPLMDKFKIENSYKRSNLVWQKWRSSSRPFLDENLIWQLCGPIEGRKRGSTSTGCLKKLAFYWFYSNWTIIASHGIRICIKRKKIHYGKFFDFCAEKCVYN